ncbi:diacylglycerol kinase family protein [Aquibium sp. A9E412]|uniref:diacylglycerol/lipid kinase family protein n=1 Tax=Aquibium sp. A9E412 TaxID=2976767 RepID=UPI0025AEEE5F|nr:diacylglycerol kinase family protein [Aquibium sp. A9E412]MDN2565405.1 diacylglycerol kinase family protein [Aquibium sp. A9E412]
MHFLAVLNRNGGALATMDLDALADHIAAEFAAAGHTVEIRVVSGAEIPAALEAAAGAHQAEAVLAGGGDGTISAFAGRLMDSGKALAILPAGTMNLFARSLGIPLEPYAAVSALAAGRRRRVDIASANGHPFVHQYSLGMHPELIDVRSRMHFETKLGKLRATARAALEIVWRPPRLRLALALDGGARRTVSVAGLAVTNNPYGEGHLPYTDTPDGGVLGVYVTRARRRRDVLRFFLNMALGRWRANDQVEMHEAKAVHVAVLSPRRRFKCAIDGELKPLDGETHVKIHAGALEVVVPADGAET